MPGPTRWFRRKFKHLPPGSAPKNYCTSSCIWKSHQTLHKRMHDLQAQDPMTPRKPWCAPGWEPPTQRYLDAGQRFCPDRDSGSTKKNRNCLCGVLMDKTHFSPAHSDIRRMSLPLSCGVHVSLLCVAHLPLGLQLWLETGLHSKLQHISQWKLRSATPARPCQLRSHARAHNEHREFQRLQCQSSLNRPHR